MLGTSFSNTNLPRKRRRVSIGLMAILACGSIASAESAKPSPSVTIWTDGDQFVQLAPQDTLANGSPAAANTHPVTLDPNDVVAALTKIRIRRSDETYHLFDTKTARRLATPLSKALSRAAPNQDALFAVLMWIKGEMLGSTDVTVAGRAFFLDGRLHVVIGDLHRSAVAPEFFRTPNASRKIDRRVHPHVPGQRAKETRYDDDAQFETAPGVGLFDENGKQRGDWLVLDVAALAKKSPPSATVDEPSTAPATSQPAQSTAAPSLEERLLRLKRLREQNLLSDDEYTRKRREILDQL
jgi:hypothetical protein